PGRVGPDHDARQHEERDGGETDTAPGSSEDRGQQEGRAEHDELVAHQVRSAGASMTDTCALTIFHPPSKRTHVCDWRPRRLASPLLNSQSTVALTSSNVVMTVFSSVRVWGTGSAAARHAAIAWWP